VELAESLRQISNSLNVTTTAVVSHMNAPLGHAVGNSLEIYESVACLQGVGPRDLEELVRVEGGLLLLSANLVQSREEGEAQIEQVLHNGLALAKFKEMLIFQGVDPQLAEALIQADNKKVLQPALFTSTFYHQPREC